jgi:hypothetical protein
VTKPAVIKVISTQPGTSPWSLQKRLRKRRCADNAGRSVLGLEREDVVSVSVMVPCLFSSVLPEEEWCLKNSGA